MLTTSPEPTWAYAPYIDVDFYGKPTRAFLDTGAFTTIISAQLFELTPFSRKDLIPCLLNVLDANGKKLPILGSIPALVQTPIGHFFDSVLVFQAESIVQHDVLIGVNILHLTNIDFAHSVLTFFRQSIIKKHRERASEKNRPQKYVRLNLTSGKIKGLEQQEIPATNTIVTVRATR